LPTFLFITTVLPRYSETLPIFPAFLTLQALSFISPLLGLEITVDQRLEMTSELLNATVFPLLFWFVFMIIGWTLTPKNLFSGRKLAKPLSNALKSPGYMPHAALVFMIALQAFLGSQAYWSILGRYAFPLLAPLRAFVTLAGLAGGFVGAYCWSRGRLKDNLVWLLLLITPILQAMRSLLLSSIQGILFASLLGMWLGRSRKAVAITISVLLFLSFINSGKVVMREKYWGEGISPPINPIVLIQEWIEGSLEAREDEEKRAQDLFTQRYNNLQNLLYVEQQLASGIPPMGGLSLSVIPQVLVPRILNPDKIRSQEGQVLLNLYFGRQRSREDTTTAYIAWGMLAEAVGNFGRFIGPLAMGLLTGSLLRITENIGRGQLLLSTPGLISLALGLLWLTAYEMVYSTFSASAFQIIIAVSFVGWWFTRGKSLPS
jgi:hypothetical protein